MNQTFKQFLTEGAAESTFEIEINDGSSYTIKAENAGEAKKKANKRLSTGQRVIAVRKDTKGQSDIEDRKKKLKATIENSQVLAKMPSDKKSVLLSLKRAKTVDAVKAVSDTISKLVSKEKPKKADDEGKKKVKN